MVVIKDTVGRGVTEKVLAGGVIPQKDEKMTMDGLDASRHLNVMKIGNAPMSVILQTTHKHFTMLEIFGKKDAE